MNAVRSGAWLAADVLLAVVDFDSSDGTDAAASAMIEGSPVATEARCEWLPPSEPEGLRRALFTVRVGPPRPDSRSIEVTFESGSTTASLGPAPAPALGVDLRALAREHLAGLDAVARGRIITFLLRATDGLDSGVDPHRLSESLALLRDALRSPHPRIGSGSEAPRELRIDRLVRVDERSFFVHGWVHDRQAPIVRLSAISPEGSRVELLEQSARVRRPDLDGLFALSGSEKLGFVCSLALDAPSRLGRGWIFELENLAGSVVEVDAPEPVEDPLAARDAIVSTLESVLRYL